MRIRLKKDENKEREVWRFLSDFHQALIRNLHDYQRNFTQLLVAVIAGMAAFGYGAKVYLSDPCPQNAIFFTICTLATIILLIVVIFMANINGYHHRLLQILLWRIEHDVFKVTKSNQGSYLIIPKKWNPCKEKEKDIELPEMYKFFKKLAFWIIIVCIFLLLFILKIKNALSLFSLALLVGMIIHLTLCFQWKIWKEGYSKRLQKLCEDSEILYKEKSRKIFEKILKIFCN